MLTRLLVSARARRRRARPGGADRAAPAAPTGLHGFLLRADEPAVDTFPRTPSFAWTPYDRAQSYDFQLATSKTLRRQRDRLVDREPLDAADGAGRVAPGVAAVDDRQPVRALRARPRPHRLGRSRAGARRSASTCAGSRCPSSLARRPGLVRWRRSRARPRTRSGSWTPRKVIATDHERRRRARVLQLPPGLRLDGDGPVARPRGAQALRLAPERPAGRLDRPVEPTRSSRRTRPCPSGGLTPTRAVSDTIVDRSRPGRARSDAGLRLQRRTPRRTASAARLYRVYVSTDRQCVNTVFTRRRRRQPRLRPANERPARTARPPRRRSPPRRAPTPPTEHRPARSRPTCNP